MVGLYFEPEGSYYLTETRLRKTVHWTTLLGYVVALRK